MTGTLFDPRSNSDHGHPEATRCVDYGCTVHEPAPPRVLALDLSLRASGICDHRGHLSTFSPMAEGDDRLVDITRHVLDATGWTLADATPPLVDLVAIEGPFASMSRTAVQLGMLHGAVRSELIRRGIPYLVVAPSQLKTYATGKGAGKGTDKAGMAVALHKRAGLEPQDDNQVDAWWLRALALDLLGHPVLELPQSHRRALDKLEVPAGYLPSSG